MEGHALRESQRYAAAKEKTFKILAMYWHMAVRR